MLFPGPMPPPTDPLLTLMLDASLVGLLFDAPPPKEQDLSDVLGAEIVGAEAGAQLGYSLIGAALLWPDVSVDNVFKQHPLTTHAAEVIERAGVQKWAANAWIHMRDFRTPYAKGLTG